MRGIASSFRFYFSCMRFLSFILVYSAHFLSKLFSSTFKGKGVSELSESRRLLHNVGVAVI